MECERHLVGVAEKLPSDATLNDPSTEGIPSGSSKGWTNWIAVKVCRLQRLKPKSPEMGWQVIIRHRRRPNLADIVRTLPGTIPMRRHKWLLGYMTGVRVAEAGRKGFLERTL